MNVPYFLSHRSLIIHFIPAGIFREWNKYIWTVVGGRKQHEKIRIIKREEGEGAYNVIIIIITTILYSRPCLAI